jgi:dTDP-4-amino-4,6-dideoxygalactose transaminase
MRARESSHESALDCARAYVDQDDVDAVSLVLRRGALSSGQALARFEAGLAQASGAPHAVAVTSATAALQLAYHALGLGAGRDLWTSANAGLGTASAAQLCGARVEFLDIDLGTGNLDVRELEHELEHRPAPHALAAVHFAGLPCDMEWLIALKRRHDFLLIEDATQALGARYRVDGRWYRAGEHPEVDATLLSFHAGAHVTTGEGGAVLTHDAARAARLRRLRAQGTDPDADVTPFDEAQRPSWFQPMVELGFQCTLSELQAALGSSQLEKLPEFQGARREIALRYLAELRGLVLPHPGGLGENADKEHAWGRFVVRTAPEERDALLAFLRQRGIQAEVHHYPLPLEPWFRGRTRARPFPNACAHARSALSLPIYPALSDGDQGRVIAALSEWQRGRSVA